MQTPAPRSELFDTAPPAPPRSALGTLKAGVNRAVSAALLPILSRAAPDSVGGETLDEAWAVALRLKERGLGHTLGYWDTAEDTPAKVAGIYLAAIERIGGDVGYLSIKPPALRFDPGAARELAGAATAAGVRLHCDSHGTNVADLTFGFIDDLLAGLNPELVSVTLPGRWRRSLEDAGRVIAIGIGARIVKGEWPDPDDPDRDLSGGFLEVADRLAGRARLAAVATHDTALAEAALGRLAGMPAELEFIFGSQSQALMDLAARGKVAARAYVPFGKGFVPSALRALRRNPRIALDALRHLMRGG